MNKDHKFALMLYSAKILVIGFIIWLMYFHIDHKRKSLKTDTFTAKTEIIFEGDTLVLDKLGNIVEIKKHYGKEKIN